MSNSGKSTLGNRKVITHEIQLGDFGFLRKVELVRICDLHLVSGDLKHLDRFASAHEDRLSELLVGRTPLLRTRERMGFQVQRRGQRFGGFGRMTKQSRGSV